jgi:transcriptional regulator with XRE-family HTH domain
MNTVEYPVRKQNKAVRKGIDPAAFMPDRMKGIREELGMNKTKAADLLNISKMAYGRYESGERTPSYQYIVYISQMMGTSPEYLTGKTDDPSPVQYVVNKETEPELFELVKLYREQDEKTKGRIQAYMKKFQA